MRAGRGRTRNYVRFTFAGFVLLHSVIQAYRAASGGALPAPGPETEPWFVAIVLLGVWLPFLIFSGFELARPREGVGPRPAAPPEQRALEKVEPLALVVVVAFALLHTVQLAWPLLVGRLLAGDVRPKIVELLSSTRSGVPLQAIAALSAVGAASFYALRQLQRALPDARPVAARGMVALAVLSYLLGSYAVIRSASGSLLP
ncbi:MAG: hypothetical protein ABIQ16_05150 [Polyangiaceae bacterium]